MSMAATSSMYDKDAAVLYYIWYQSYTPEGALWCSTGDAAQFLEYNARWTGEGHLTSKKMIASRPTAFYYND